MKLHPTPLPGLMLAQSASHDDERGRFQRVYCAGALAEAGHALPVSQANVSLTRGRGALRGLHFQHPPAGESKLVRCLRGRVFDVAVDLRAGSPTFLRWFGTELAGGDSLAMLIPAGFAHGFQVLGDEAEMLYFHSSPWSPGHEGGLRHDDPRLGIGWPLPVATLSDRDRGHPLLTPDFAGIEP
ncbi:dTDP-4-dehydrorhamnose 3,5-epimerase [Arenimonas soli]|uniref:dTDP-4-dehydrorhamnose 3,5-epimerase n=1 Tax=Arenimonas soli TaxID=2269504 RepID=A0ABQ1HPI3_9GAMM|nr:dTDP-4-dehydrorhamnose 3,5-epimerase family protein [Arenimonas soli]GGA85086.1 dTDP-4-dehydrorhamnose 3,5-epimerase [Arenimonas soli]